MLAALRASRRPIISGHGGRAGSVRRNRPRARTRLLYLFGSRAKGGAQPKSDWDFAVLFETDPGMDRLSRTAALELDILKIVPGRVEVTALEGAGAVFRFEVVSTGRCLFARTRDDRVLFEARACREYEDDAHRRRIYAEANRRFFGDERRTT